MKFKILKDLISFEAKSKIKAGDGLPIGKYPFYTSSSIQRKYLNDYLIDNECLIFGTGGQASIHYAIGKFSVSTDCYVVVNKDATLCNLRYVYHYLRGNIHLLENEFKGVGLKHISKSSLENLPILLPSLPEQRRIAHLLDKADALRHKNKQLLAAYDELLKATFLEMFGDPLRNEKGWEVKHLSEVSEVVSGVTKGRQLDGKQLITLPYMRVANVQDGHLNLSEIKTIDVLPSDFEKYKLRSGDILLTEGGDPDKLGRGAIWNNEIQDCIHQNHIFRVRISAENLTEQYLCALIGSAYGKNFFLRAAKQTTGIASINSSQLKRFPVLIPPIASQIAYKKAIVNIEVQKRLALESMQESDDLFCGLVQEVIRGRD